MIRISLMIWRLPGECAATTTVADCSVLPLLWLIGYCRELCIHLVFQFYCLKSDTGQQIFSGLFQLSLFRIF